MFSLSTFGFLVYFACGPKKVSKPKTQFKLLFLRVFFFTFRFHHFLDNIFIFVFLNKAQKTHFLSSIEDQMYFLFLFLANKVDF
jgi:hypothetical protein